jgi:hypothetical protein
MKSISSVVLAWWLVWSAVNPGSTAGTQGPFKSQAACEKVGIACWRF